jgi:hypothetical protein
VFHANILRIGLNFEKGVSTLLVLQQQEKTVPSVCITNKNIARENKLLRYLKKIFKVL